MLTKLSVVILSLATLFDDVLRLVAKEGTLLIFAFFLVAVDFVFLTEAFFTIDFLVVVFAADFFAGVSFLTTFFLATVA